jgi:carbon storage regulator
MLVLSRKVGETIIIDGDVRVTVVAIRGRETRLGIEAPEDVVILRGELAPFGSRPAPLAPRRHVGPSPTSDRE